MRERLASVLYETRRTNSLENRSIDTLLEKLSGQSKEFRKRVRLMP